MSMPFDFLGEKPGIASSISPVDPGTRADILKGLSRRVHGVFASPKNGVPIPWRNRDERDLLGLLEVDATVVGFTGMPEKVTFAVDGGYRSHVPTVRIETHLGEAVLDARPPCDGIAKTMALIYAARGIPYLAVDARTIRLMPRHGNVRFVLGHRGFAPGQTAMIAAKVELARQAGLTIAELARRMGGADPVPAICAMALAGLLHLDLSAAVTTEMAVKLAPGAGR